MTKGKAKVGKGPNERENDPKYLIEDEEWASMSSTEQERYLRSFRTLDNGTGWNPLEAALFYLVLKKYGCGNWETVSYFLPHQNTAQFNTFCQKLFGQQSLYAFSGLRVDPYAAYVSHCALLGLRKNGVRVHEGVPMSTAAKKVMKQGWAKQQRAMTYDIPIVEDRSRNYTKIWWQMETTMDRIRTEAKKRGSDCLNKVMDIDMGPDHYKHVNHKKFIDQPYEWPKPTVWQLDVERRAQRGQDNLWPLIRMVEDEDWYKSDQALHWSFVDGTIFKNRVFRKQFKNEEGDLPDLSLAGLDPAKMRRRCNLKKVPGEYEMEVEAEGRPVEDDDDNDEQVFGHVASWSCDQLLQYLREERLSEVLLKILEERQITGKKSFSFTMEEADEIFEDKKLLDLYDKAMMNASRKFGFHPRE